MTTKDKLKSGLEELNPIECDDEIDLAAPIDFNRFHSEIAWLTLTITLLFFFMNTPEE